MQISADNDSKPAEMFLCWTMNSELAGCRVVSLFQLTDESVGIFRRKLSSMALIA